jgi:hypothetical protein
LVCWPSRGRFSLLLPPQPIMGTTHPHRTSPHRRGNQVPS